MLSASDRKWAQGWKVPPETIKWFQEELLKAQKDGSYRVYNASVEDMDEDEIKVAYSNMRNYLSDMRTHN